MMCFTISEENSSVLSLIDMGRQLKMAEYLPDKCEEIFYH